MAGLAAVQTAKNMGAVVKAFDVRPAVKEQIQSLGGEFLEVDFKVYFLKTHTYIFEKIGVLPPSGVSESAQPPSPEMAKKKKAARLKFKTNSLGTRARRGTISCHEGHVRSIDRLLIARIRTRRYVVRAWITVRAKGSSGGSGVGFLVLSRCFNSGGPTRPISLTLTQTPLPQLTAWSQFMAGAWSCYPVDWFCVRPYSI